MDYIELLNGYKEDMLETLRGAIACKSVASTPVRTRDGDVLPYGRGVQDALEYMLEEGARLGFDAYNLDNRAGYLEIKADLEEGVKAPRFDIVGHLDVVPVTEGWSSDPWTLTEKDGKIYGRGVSDDKGPLVACMYAIKALVDSGVKFKQDIRIVMGLDEELGESSISHYVEKCGNPDAGFTPDSDFPLINGEKGILVFELARKLSKQVNKDGLRLTKLEAGTVHNTVAQNARAVVAAEDKYYDLIKDRLSQYVMETGYNVKAKKQGSSLVIEAVGIAAHGTHPEAGLNAVSIMMDFLGRIQFLNEEINDFIAFYNDHIGFDFHGERLGCQFCDEFGELTLNVGRADINEDIAQLTIDIRYPVTMENGEEVFAGIERTIGNEKIGIVKGFEATPVYMPLEHELVGNLMSAYRDETGDTASEPMVIGGGTYAKFVSNILAFGAIFPGEENTMHQADEYVSIESFMKMARIYARVLAQRRINEQQDIYCDAY